MSRPEDSGLSRAAFLSRATAGVALVAGLTGFTGRAHAAEINTLAEPLAPDLGLVVAPPPPPRPDVPPPPMAPPPSIPVSPGQVGLPNHGFFLNRSAGMRVAKAGVLTHRDAAGLAALDDANAPFKASLGSGARVFPEVPDQLLALGSVVYVIGSERAPGRLEAEVVWENLSASCGTFQFTDGRITVTPFQPGSEDAELPTFTLADDVFVVTRQGRGRGLPVTMQTAVEDLAVQTASATTRGQQFMARAVPLLAGLPVLFCFRPRTTQIVVVGGPAAF